MGRIENKAVFEDTRELCKNNVVIKRAVQASTAGQKLILENDIISKSEKERFDEDVKIVVSKKRTFEAASDYSDMRVAVHNFASASNPGGGVVNGANAQEECLCRCSGLYFSLNTKEMWDGFYQPHRDTYDPLHNDDIIYTPDVIAEYKRAFKVIEFAIYCGKNGEGNYMAFKETITED